MNTKWYLLDLVQIFAAVLALLFTFILLFWWHNYTNTSTVVLLFNPTPTSRCISSSLFAAALIASWSNLSLNFHYSKNCKIPFRLSLFSRLEFRSLAHVAVFLFSFSAINNEFNFNFLKFFKWQYFFKSAVNKIYLIYITITIRNDLNLQFVLIFNKLRVLEKFM